MSLFGELDVQSAEEIDYSIPDNTYPAFVFDVKVGRTKADPSKNKVSKLGMTIVYKISEGDYEGRQVQEWKQIPEPVDPKNLTEDEKKSLSYLKTRMLSLGVPENRVNSVGPDDLIGSEVVITLVSKGEYQNVRKVVPKADVVSLSDKFGG